MPSIVGGSGGMLPQKILKIRCSEVHFGTLSSGMKCFRPIRSLVTLKFPAIDNIFHIFFLLPEIKGGGGAGPMIF